VCGLLAFLTYIQQENVLVSFTAVITNGGHIQKIRFCQPYRFQNTSITYFGIKMYHSLMSIIPKLIPDFLHYTPNNRNGISSRHSNVFHIIFHTNLSMENRMCRLISNMNSLLSPRKKIILLGGHPGQMPGSLMLLPLEQCWTNCAYKQMTVKLRNVLYSLAQTSHLLTCGPRSIETVFTIN